MIINVKLIRSTFFFLDEITLRKGGDPTAIDISQRSDGFIKSILLALRADILEADIELQDLVKFIKDIPTRIEAQRFLGIPEDIIEVKAYVEVEAEDVVEAVEPTENAVEDKGDSDEEGQKEGVLDDLLEGNVKQVVAKIRQAKLSDEQKIELISIEEAGKNRSIVIAAINEA